MTETEKSSFIYFHAKFVYQVYANLSLSLLGKDLKLSFPHLCCLKVDKRILIRNLLGHLRKPSLNNQQQQQQQQWQRQRSLSKEIEIGQLL